MVEREFVVDMFGCDFYTSEEAAQEQQGRLEVSNSGHRDRGPRHTSLTFRTSLCIAVASRIITLFCMNSCSI